jgi:RimJ/RimL family protein N-acetyltransferase
MHVTPLTLTGRHVQLEPLSTAHIAGLQEAVRSGELWKLRVTRVASPEAMEAAVAEALALQAAGQALPFATVERAGGRVVGATRFGSLRPADKSVEIGWTWIGAAWQRTAVNTEAKYLMLCHAFEVWRCNRVELKTDALNTQSRRAIERLGASQEGVLRRHMVMPDGRIRDTVYFSIIAEEWPSVKTRLEARLAGA